MLFFFIFPQQSLDLNNGHLIGMRNNRSKSHLVWGLESKVNVLVRDNVLTCISVFNVERYYFMLCASGDDLT